MVLKQTNKCFVFLFLLQCCRSTENLTVSEDDILDLYDKYKEAAADENKPKSSRRVFINNVEYQLHVNKLKDVNGFKTHNLLLRTGGQPNVNKTIYIINPLESKLPQAYMSLEEFKQALTNKIQKQKEEVRGANLKAELHKTQMNTKLTMKPKPTRTIYLKDDFKSLDIKVTETPKAKKPKRENKTNKITMKFDKVNTNSVKDVIKDQKILKFTKKITEKIATQGNIKNITIKRQNQNISLKNTEPIPLQITRNLIFRSFENTTITDDDRASKNITVVEPELNIEIETTTDTVANELNMETVLSELDETTESAVTDPTETVTESETESVTESETESETKAETEAVTDGIETETLEPETEEPSTTTKATRATLGRPAVFLGRQN